MAVNTAFVQQGGAPENGAALSLAFFADPLLGGMESDR
jgi:hypothetical protein